MIEDTNQRIRSKVPVTIALVLAVLAAEGTVAGGNELHAPWSGLVIALGAGMLVAVGLAAGRWGMLAATAVHCCSSSPW